MIAPRSSIVLALVLCSSQQQHVSAFTSSSPSCVSPPSGGCLKNERIGVSHKSSSRGAFISHAKIEQSLKFWKLEEEVVGATTKAPSAAAIDAYVDRTFSNKDDEDEIPLSTGILIGSGLLSFSYAMQRLQVYLNTPCLNAEASANMCTAQYHDFAEYFGRHEFLSFMMILTHCIPFALLPWVSKQVSEVGPTIKKDFPDFNPFLMQTAMACMGFGLALEFGWHVNDSWYYENNFHILNFGFYFFLISGFSLWADGIKAKPAWDLVFGAILLAASIMYPFGNGIQIEDFSRVPAFAIDLIGDKASSAKIPLYAGMTVPFLAITRRGLDVFGKKMWWVPFFCVVVNLSFIFALNGVQYGNALEIDGIKQLVPENYIYHICHDILGTELGVLVFGLLVKNYVPLAERNNDDMKSQQAF